MLSLEPLLTARLEELSGFKGVHGLPELMAAEMASRPSPCLYLVFDGYRPIETDGAGKAAKIETRWLVVVSVKNASKAGDGAPARAKAAPLIKAALGHLLGWKASPGYGPLILAPAPRADFAAGVLLYPLAFTTTQVVKAD